jgi:hypothetical protein
LTDKEIDASGVGRANTSGPAATNGAYTLLMEGPMENNPFDSIESAHEFVRLLAAEVDNVREGVRHDIAEAGEGGSGRQLDALQLVDFKLGQLAHHLTTSSRLLNDLTMLRRVLLRDADAAKESEI